MWFVHKIVVDLPGLEPGGAEGSGRGLRRRIERRFAELWPAPAAAPGPPQDEMAALVAAAAR